MVEPANIVLPGQCGGRQKRCISVNMEKVYSIQQNARTQGERADRVDIVLKYVFNAMSQAAAALWQVIQMFRFRMST